MENKQHQYHLVYLASPFSHPDSEIREKRFKDVYEATIRLLKKNIYAFSPILYNFQMHLDYDLPTDWGFWMPYDLAFLERCSEMIVVMLDGWDISVGVAAEVKYAQEHGIPVNYVKLEDL
jgi:nucleoside 2-deoxyribosyltransferase